MTIDPYSDIPAYKQLAGGVRALIESGDLAPGQRIPSESDLVQRHGVARETARRAIALLRAEGLIQTIQGQGSFVTDPQEAVTVRCRKGTEIAARMPSPDERRALGIPEGVPIFIVRYPEGQESKLRADSNVILFTEE
ncbi:GntR family transcriptional regulator [Sphaerimonospora mesophila]|uniref:GntR family transcriptional regulator n=1 Tax=Sphaerimonospora mesophila TaxID=37483 RepID=UPI0006E2EFB8